MNKPNTRTSQHCRLLAAIATALSAEAGVLRAAEPEETTTPRVDVIGTVENLPYIAGTATILGPEELETARVFTISEALRKAPGVYVRDEEGFGLRPNIGIRGLNPSRSTKVLLLEDGIPLSYAPYGDNASYYHPPIDRFESVEVFKGSEQIRFGPQTAGGVVNYITPLPTRETSGSVALTAGNRDYFNGHARLSKGGVLLDYVHKSGDGSRDNIHSNINDFNIKAVIDLGDNQALTLRANYYGEDSQVTYSGLTETEFRNFGRFYNPFKNDSFESNRYGTSATHQAQLTPNALLTTNAYFAYFSRDWWRQSSTTTDTQCDVPPANPTYAAQTGATFQATRASGLRVNPDLCNSIQGRLRDYTTYGVEPRLQLNHGAFGIRNELEVAVRAHYETQDRKQENGTTPTSRTGTLSEDNERLTQAYSAFVQNRFIFGRWTVTPGVRVEHIKYERTNRLANGGAGASGETDLTEWIPALGATFNPSTHTTIYAGVHRGFSPPRTEDIIGNTATAGALPSVDVPADDAIEAEIGVRTTPREGVYVQAAAFRNDFSEQVVVGSVAGGNLPMAVGEALYQGAEVSGRVELGSVLGWNQNVYLRLAYQWLPTARQESAFRQVANGAAISGSAEGKRVPYAPEHLLNFGIGYVHPRGFGAEVEMVYTSEQFADFANTATPAFNGDGQTGILEDYTIFNLALNYTIPNTRWTTFFTVKNLTDEEYIADRTRGILPGTPRLYQAGVQYRF
jgi:Fe(3+) dicitrate transport protein